MAAEPVTKIENDQQNFAVEALRVSKRFGGVTALDNVTVQVRTGELLAICGENGAGKSTLMKILCGQHTEYEGEIRLRGKPVRFSGIKDAEDKGISIIHQELNLVEELSVAANIFLGREIASGGFLSNRKMNQRAAELLNQLQCDISPKTVAGSLRIGDQQLIEIAKALSLGSDILIMDEPTSALTEVEVDRLNRVIAQLRDQDVTILYISHKMDEIFRLADRITVLRDGKFVATVNRQDVQSHDIAHMMVGREFELDDNQSNDDRGKSEKPALKVTDLWRSWPGHGQKWRFKDIHFSVEPGEIVGFAGLMGAGRTELFECLFGFCDDRFGGKIELDGTQVRFTHPSQALRAGVAMVTEDRKRMGLFNNLTVRENVTLCSLSNNVRGKYLLSGSKERSNCQRMIDQLQIKLAGHNAAITSLSGGNQQKCVIGRSMLTSPKVLLLDDPTRGVDVGAKAEIYRLMRSLADDGIAILMTSSELPELLMVCHRIIVLCEGQITGEYSRAEATEEKIMESATSF